MAIDMTFIYRFRTWDNEKKVGREKGGEKRGGRRRGCKRGVRGMGKGLGKVGCDFE